jgi:hypothetical protein
MTCQLWELPWAPCQLRWERQKLLQGQVEPPWRLVPGMELPRPVWLYSMVLRG